MPPVSPHPYFLAPNAIQRDKPLFVFLPGLDGTGLLLRNQIPALEPVFDIRCLAIPPDNLMGWDTLTEKVIGLVQAEISYASSPQAIYLCGESFGGCLALKLAEHSPHLFEGFVLINPALSFRRFPWLGWGGQLVQWFPEPLYQLSSMGLLPFLTALERFTVADRRFFLKTIRSVPQATSVWRLSMMQSFNPDVLRLNRLTQPVLIVASGADRLLPSVLDGQNLADRLSKVQLHVLPHSGHACLLEQHMNLAEILYSQTVLGEFDKASSQPIE
jgi:pimeloyl-ACP methyl ester carboxylesterase